MTLTNQILRPDNDDYEDHLRVEDITIEGSPLHDYLHDLCLNEEDVKVNYESDCITGGSNLYRFWHGTSIKEYLQTQWKLCRTKVSGVFPGTDDILIKMSHYYHVKYGREILESKVMLEEDLDYLCLQTPRQFLYCIMKKKHEVLFVTDSVKQGHMSRHLMLIFCYVACLVAFLLTPLVPTIIHLSLASLTFFVTCFNLRLQIIIEMWKRNHNRNLELLRQFLKSSEKFHSVVRRAIRLVQDMEVVSRGYTLVNGKTPVSRMETNHLNSPRAFPKLRLTLLRCLVKCILSCREAMQNLTQYKLTNNCGSDLDAFSICSIPLSEFGVCFSEDTSEAELYVATDGYALSVLKTLNELLFKQRSEFLTRLSLTLSETTWNVLPEGFFSVFPSMLSNPNQTTIDSIALMQSSYEMHKHVTMTKDKSPFKSENADDKRTSASTLRINLHSLQSHMRAAMYKSLEMEDSIPEMKMTKPEIKDFFENLKTHLDVSLECWNQCMKEVDLHYGCQKHNHGDGVTVSVKNNEDSSKINKNNDDDALDDEENAEDQVFEATTEGQTDNDGNSKHYADDSTEKTVLEESATVIRELRSVLANKTSEKQREMWKSKLFPSNKSKHHKDKKEENTSLENTSKQENVLLQNTPKNEALANPCNDCPDLPSKKDFASSSSKFELVNSSQQTQFLSDDVSDTALSCHKRPTLLGRRRPTLRKYKHKPGDAHLPQMDSCEIDPLPKDSKPSSEVDVLKSTSPDSRETTMDWASGLGIGFSSSLAQQAVSIARKRNPLAANAVTYGSDSSDGD